ncbi:MAG: hypothetical protein ACR2JC_07540 [Chloroflexota bacterium]
MTPPKRVRLRIVDSEAVRPHEVADPGRERRIEARLRSDGVLRDPLMVGSVPDIDGYVLLDGTNRRRALAAIGLRWALVQILDYADAHAVELRTWCHAAGRPLVEVVREAHTIPDIDITALHPLEASDALREPATLAVLLDHRQRFALRRTAMHCTPRPEQLRRLVDLYEDGMVREDCQLDEVEERAATAPAQLGGDRCLIAFPPFSRSQVLSMAMEEVLIPAGITRHVVTGGRALRVNVPLNLLSSERNLDEANLALETHLATLQPRSYQEPTVLYDS